MHVDQQERGIRARYEIINVDVVQDLEDPFDLWLGNKMVDGADGESQKEAKAINTSADDRVGIAVDVRDAGQDRQSRKSKEDPAAVNKAIDDLLRPGINLIKFGLGAFAVCLLLFSQVAGHHLLFPRKRFHNSLL